jgi:hypothetical protein
MRLPEHWLLKPSPINPFLWIYVIITLPLMIIGGLIGGIHNWTYLFKDVIRKSNIGEKWW